MTVATVLLLILAFFNVWFSVLNFRGAVRNADLSRKNLANAEANAKLASRMKRHWGRQ